MTYSNEQYENVAIFLDGGDIALSDEELKLAEEISHDQGVVSAWLEDPTSIPAGHTRKHRNGIIWKKVIFPAIATAATIAIIASIAMNLLPREEKDTTNSLAATDTSEIIESIAEINTIIQQQQQAELATLLLEQESFGDDPVAQDMASNSDQWFQALGGSNNQSLALPENTDTSA